MINEDLKSCYKLGKIIKEKNNKVNEKQAKSLLGPHFDIISKIP